VHRVTGCIDVYYAQSSLTQPYVSVFPEVNWINRHLPLWYYAKVPLSATDGPYATTYDCPLSGNVVLTVEGINFGSTPRIFIAGVECYVTALAPAPDALSLDSAQCLLPGTDSGFRCVLCVLCVLCVCTKSDRPFSHHSKTRCCRCSAGLPPPGTLAPGLAATVRVENGKHPGLFFEFPGLRYRGALPVVDPPVVTNIGAYKVIRTPSSLSHTHTRRPILLGRRPPVTQSQSSRP
jgi:hypothetical protein